MRIRISDLRFIRHGSQPIELLLEDMCRIFMILYDY